MNYSRFSHLKADCSKHEAQLLKNNGCLTFIYSYVLLTVPVTTNVVSAVVYVSEALQRDNQVGNITGKFRTLAIIHQIRFQLGLCPRPCWGSSQPSPRPPSWILGASFAWVHQGLQSLNPALPTPNLVNNGMADSRQVNHHVISHLGSVHAAF